MKFINKLQSLPINQKLIILWSIVIIIGVVLATWRINALKPKFENLTKTNIQTEMSATSYEESVEEMRKGFELIKESTEAIKEGFGFIKDITNEIKNLEEIPEDFNFIIENNKN